MGIDIKPLVKKIFDIGSEPLEKSAQKIVLLAGAVVLVLILVWKRG
jgi:hypothetical protein